MSRNLRQIKMRSSCWIRTASAIVALAVVTLAAPQPKAQGPAVQSSLPAAARPVFDAASIKVNESGGGRHSLALGLPGGRVRAINVSLAGFMTAAYQVPASRILGAPAWFDSADFDLEATSEGNSPVEQNRLRLQSLLADRFKLVTHHETRQLPIYALVLAKPGKLGPQLHLNNEKCDPSPPASSQGFPASTGTIPSLNCGDTSEQATPNRVRLTGRKAIMNQLLVTLAGPASNPNIDRPIEDRTGLTGTIDFTLEFAPLQVTPSIAQPAADAPELPSLSTALLDQLGLKLEPQRGPVDVLVIDHVEEPSPN